MAEVGTVVEAEVKIETVTKVEMERQPHKDRSREIIKALEKEE